MLPTLTEIADSEKWCLFSLAWNFLNFSTENNTLRSYIVEFINTFFPHAFQQLLLCVTRECICLFLQKEIFFSLSSIHTFSCILYFSYLTKIAISNRFWTRNTLLPATDNEHRTFCLSKMPETSWQKYVTFILGLSVIFLWCCIIFGLQKDSICALHAKAFLCIFKIGSTGSFAFAGTGLRNTITRFSECSKIGETNMNIYRYSKVICIVQILLLQNSNESFIALFNGISVIHFAVLLLTIWCLKTFFHSWVNIEQKKTSEDEMLDAFSVVQTISVQFFVLRLFNIAFFKEEWKIVASLHNFHIWFWMSQETTSCTNISITESITCLQDQISSLISHCLLWLVQYAFGE